MLTIFLIILFFTVIIVIVGYLYLIWNFGYWKKRDVREAKSIALFGSFPNRKKKIIYDMDNIYNEFKNDENFVGVFLGRQPQLLLLAPKLVHEVYVTKFKYFRDNAYSSWIDKDVDQIIGNNPFFLRGKDWEEKRSEMSPTVTPSRIKVCYPIMQQVGKKMTSYIKNILVKSSKQNIDVKDLGNRFTGEVLSDSVYGFDGGCFTEENNSILTEAKIVSNHFFDTFMLKYVATAIPLTKIFVKSEFMKESSKKFFKQLLHNAIQQRQHSKSDRADILNCLLQLKHKKKLSQFEILTHSVSFFAGGFEVSAALIGHCLLCLARNKSAQEQLRNDILKNLGDDDTLSFDKLNEMDYLDQCFQETLRIFTPVAFLAKVCTESVELENTLGRKLKINVGEIINIPVHSIHHDEKYYPNPEEFIPQRFSKENGGANKYKDEGKFLPFGDGPRTCLGLRFALIQSKTAVCEIIKNFEITPSQKTRNDNYLSAQSVITLLDGGVWLNFKEIKH